MRENGFYWVRLPFQGRIEVARWEGFSDGSGSWLVAGWDGTYYPDQVTVLSERLLSPEVKSNA